MLSKKTFLRAVMIVAGPMFASLAYAQGAWIINPKPNQQFYTNLYYALDGDIRESDKVPPFFNHSICNDANVKKEALWKAVDNKTNKNNFANAPGGCTPIAKFLTPGQDTLILFDANPGQFQLAWVTIKVATCPAVCVSILNPRDGYVFKQGNVAYLTYDHVTSGGGLDFITHTWHIQLLDFQDKPFGPPILVTPKVVNVGPAEVEYFTPSDYLTSCDAKGTLKLQVTSALHGTGSTSVKINREYCAPK
jgi:hypothetical protein